MEVVKNLELKGERACYNSKDVQFENCTFLEGESPLKESKNINVINSTFKYKYPLWYCTGVLVENTVWELMGRSGVWYTNNIVVKNSNIASPKQFRRCNNVKIYRSKMESAIETLWSCNNVEIVDCHVVGDYFGMNSSDIILKNVVIDGNYCFDGGKNIKAYNCIFNSKDSFWNCENVEIYDSKINGEYLSWNTKNIMLVNCEIESDQALCYIDKLTIKNSSITNSPLAFELCSNIDATINGHLASIKNPISGVIRANSFDEIILDSDIINPEKTTIEVIK